MRLATLTRVEILAPAGADVWTIHLESSRQHLAPLRALLNSDERARADRFHFTEDRERFTVAHGALRSILAGYVGQDPAALAFDNNEYGKPGLCDGTGLAFNLSHSSNVILLAVTAGSDVGVDIEQHRADIGWEGIAQQTFSETECAGLAALPVHQQLQAFFDVWVRKEAFIKALGKGFSHPAKLFSVPLGAIAEPYPLEEHWCLHSLQAPAGYSAAIVTRAGISEVRQREFSGNLA